MTASGPISEGDLIERIDREVRPFGFVSAEHPSVVGGIEIAAAWTRKTWNTNRGIACLRTGREPRHPGEIAQTIKLELGKALRYFPFFYGIGLQIVCIGGVERGAEDLDAYVDKIDNQRSIIQSLFIIDLEQRILVTARTWGQVVSGKFQDAIAAALKDLGAIEPHAR